MNNNNINEQKVDAIVNMSEMSTTKFLGDGEQIEVSPINDKPLPSELTDQTTNSVPNQDIKTILRRPIRLRSGVLSSASTGLLHFCALPSEMLASTMYAEKVKGFLSFRARMMITLQVNANRFSQGRLILGYMPAATIKNAYPYNRLLNLQQVTALPHVELDIGTKSSCSIDIPFVNNLLYYDLSTSAANATDCGAFFVYVYSPYDPGSGTNADYTVWANFEDIDISIPAYKFQMGYSNMSDKELKAAGKVTRFSSYVGSATSILKDSDIPLISSIAGVANWFTDIVGNVAYAFGWSKPIDEEPSKSMTLDVYDKLQHVDGVSKSKKLSLFSNNKVDVLPGCSYTDCDETSIKYLTGISSFINQFSWTTSNVAGNLLAIYDVNPLVGKTDLSTSLGGILNECYTMTPLTYVSQFFRFWRGSITYTFKFVKTEFHTGRLAFVFFPSPSVDNSSGIPGFDSTNYALREIVDIHGVTEYTVTIPYMSNKVVCDAFDSTALGYLAVYVVNPLVATTTVSSTVSVLAEHSAGSDIEYFGYTPRSGNGNTPFTPIVPSVLNSSAFVSQMDIGSKLTDSSNNVGNSTVKTHAAEAARYVAGEQIHSLSSLLRMTSLVTKSGESPGSFSNLVLKPFECWGITKTNTAWQIPYFQGDLFSNIVSCYAYNRGSVNLTIIDRTTNSFAKWLARLVNIPFPFSLNIPNVEFDPSTAIEAQCAQPIAVSHGDYNAGIVVNCPPYSSGLLRTPRINGTIFTNRTDVANATTDRLNYPYLLNFSTTPACDAYEIGRSAGDDFQLSAFWGIPPMSVTIQ